MRSRRVLYLIWLIPAVLLYFFENNTGTRILLAGSLLFPLVPAIRRAWTSPDRKPEAPAREAASAQSPAPSPVREEGEPGDVRGFVPGDPLNRIHWKLSARHGSLLIRESVPAPAEGEAPRPVPDVRSAAGGSRRRILLFAAALPGIPAALLFGIPSARRSAMALANRLFAASEQVNAYAYDRFEVPETVSLLPAALLLGMIFLGILAAAVLCRSRGTALAPLAGILLAQAYFGLSLPAWGNVLLFAGFALMLAGQPLSRRNAGRLLAGVAALSLMILLVWPGVDAATEAASESARDWLSRAAQALSGSAPEAPAGENETRHVHTRSVSEGAGEARPEKEYRLVTVEEQQISRPPWTDWMKIILLFALAVALLSLPFLPFLWLNARRKKAAAAREAFRSGDVAEAVCAIFQHAVSWLDATGRGAGNLPYRDWPARLSEGLPEGYARRFGEAAELFEEAAYSGHPLGEEKRSQVLDLLKETEQSLWESADRKTRFRLKYGECLTE